MKAKYVTVFEDGTRHNATCDYDPETKMVSNIEFFGENPDTECLLYKEVVLLPDGTELDETDGVIFTLEY